MSQQDIKNVTDVLIYLREYAIKFGGDQPLAIGVPYASWMAIRSELCLDEPKGIDTLKICNVQVVAVNS